MLSNKVLHKTVQDIKRITSFDCAVWDRKGICLVMTHEKMQKYEKQVQKFWAKADEEAEILQGCQGFFFVFDEGKPIYLLGLEGECANMEMAGRMGVSQLTSLLTAYKDKLDKNRFVQNLLLGNLLPVDIYNQAGKMGIAADQKRIVYVIEKKNEKEELILETLRELYASGRKDFVTSVDEQHVILVKALEQSEGYEEAQQRAREITDTLNMEAMASVRVAYGTIVQEIKAVPRSYQEAQVALEIGRVFYAERRILPYGD